MSGFFWAGMGAMQRADLEALARAQLQALAKVRNWGHAHTRARES